MRAFCLAFGLILGGTLVIPSAAFAQDTEEAPLPTVDTVVLKDGTRVRGRVTEVLPDDHVSIIVGRETKRFAWADVAKIESTEAPAITPKPTPPTPSSPSTSPSTPPALEKPPAEPPKPKPQWRANRTLVTSGAIMFGVGYGGPALAAVPSTVGLLGRVIILVLTLGLPCIFNNSGDYLCSGDHGAIQMLVPFAGPIFFAENHPRDTVLHDKSGELAPGVKVVLYVSSGLQVAGLAAIIAGLVTGKEELPEAEEKKKGVFKPSFFVAPLDAPSTVGLTVGVHRF